MIIRKATTDDREEILSLYLDGYHNALKSGVEVWEEPTADLVNEWLPNLYMIEYPPFKQRSGTLAVINLTTTPNPLIWDCEKNPACFYLSKVAVSNKALGSLGVSRVMELVFGMIGDATLRWDVLASNESTVSYYSSLGAEVVKNVTFLSPKRGTEVDVVLMEARRTP